jgi:excisionase family DNA binding protein
MKINAEKKYMGVAEICVYLNVSRQFIYKLVRNKQIPYTRLGKKYLFNIENIEKYLAGAR